MTTAPAAAQPDLLRAVLDAHPGVLSLGQMGSGHYTLTITDPEADVFGTLQTSSKDGMAILAQAVDRALLALRNPVPRCECGDSLTCHDITTRRKPCSAMPCSCAEFRPREAE